LAFNINVKSGFELHRKVVLFWVDGEVSFIILSVAKKIVAVDLNLIILINKVSINRKMKSQLHILLSIVTATYFYHKYKVDEL